MEVFLHAPHINCILTHLLRQAGGSRWNENTRLAFGIKTVSLVIHIPSAAMFHLTEHNQWDRSDWWTTVADRPCVCARIEDYCWVSEHDIGNSCATNTKRLTQQTRTWLKTREWGRIKGRRFIRAHEKVTISRVWRAVWTVSTTDQVNNSQWICGPNCILKNPITNRDDKKT